MQSIVYAIRGDNCQIFNFILTLANSFLLLKSLDGDRLEFFLSYDFE
ncbi:hypothetical protein SAMN05216323_102515 [Williamwhitmania taraxaci]|uniref:Uncharacterized protein n=1 Tax=Williamwhitmania taraxaci TaxID=1640674 RepID=A0A1G6KHU7_9BACT|nr:hypothetical protein SAMN05216323_102515 [Williamwhitmania taraxaci]